MTNNQDTFKLTYRDFYIEVVGSQYLATSYAPRHIIKADTVKELTNKIDDYLQSRE